MRLDDIGPDDPRLGNEVLEVLRELRPRLTADSLRTTAADGHAEGLRFLAAFDEDGCVGVAGWRLVHNTSAGRKLYVDDLVTRADRRSVGVGRALLDELERRARDAGCSCVDLDSGVQRADAHRFYFRERMAIAGYHFRKPLR